MDLLHALRLQALGGVLLDDNEDFRERFLRKVFRWYSREFSTPLQEVYEIPVYDVLQHYYEDRAEEMSDEELEAERKLLTETQEEREARLLAVDRELLEDDAYVKGLEDEVRKEEEARLAKKSGLPQPKKTEELGAKVRKPSSPSSYTRESTLDVPVVGPGFKIDFVEESEFARELEGLGVMDQPPKRR